MPPPTETFATLAGGLGLLLLGLSLLGDGLMWHLGRPVERLLARSARSRGRSAAAGFAAAAALHGPSLVTAATAFQLGAGRLALPRAAWRLLGAALGSLVFVWVVALLLVAFDQTLTLDTLGLPLVAIGALLRLAGAGRRLGVLGETLAGFGLLCLGLGLLAQGFDHLDLPPVGGARIAIVQLVLGTLLAVMLPAAGAPLLLAFAAVQGGLLTLQGGALVAIGAGIGAAMTTLLASVGTSPHTRRVALVQAALLAATALATLVLMPLVVHLAPAGGTGTLALLLSLGTVAALATVVPFADRLTARLATRLPAPPDIGVPRAPDDALLNAPPVAVEAHAHDVQRFTTTTRRLLRAALEGQPPSALQADRHEAEAIDAAADRFADALHRARLDPALARQLGRMRRCQHDQRASLRQAVAGAAWSDAMRRVPDAASGCSDFTARALRLLDALDADRDPAVVAERLGDTRAAGEATRLGLLTAAAAGAVDIAHMEATLRWHAALQGALDLQALAGRRPATAAADVASSHAAPLTEPAETLPST